MAIDNTPPRLKLIVTIAAITVITLIGISFATQSYYAYMSDEAKHEKIAPTRDKDEQHKAEATAFNQAGMPIDQAMAQIAKGARPEAITPTPGAPEDVGPMTGWSKLPHPAPTTLIRTPAAAPEMPMVNDAGVMLYSDGGIMLGPDGGPMMAPAMGDAGAPMMKGDAGAGGMHGRRDNGSGNGNGTGGGGGNGSGNGMGGNH
jgi:hypothetical protein